ncbi:MAG: twin-arginine translocase TatA/TatE family subunit [bacterium]|nr:twin-arginine translocase TatA/TatE family subunit [bacterium]
MFGVGIPELLVIMIIALIVIGPEKLPDIAKTLGKAFYEFKNVIDGVKTSMEEEQKEIKESLDSPVKTASIEKKGESLMQEYEDAILNKSKDKKVNKVSKSKEADKNKDIKETEA